MNKILTVAAVILLPSLWGGSGKLFAQLDTVHWIPPLHSRDNSQIEDHYIYLATPVTTPFGVAIKDGAGNTLATPVISNASPYIYIVGNGQLSGSSLFVPIDSLNKVLIKSGLVLSANQPFFAELRAQSPSQAGSSTAKGRAALGITFRVGGFPQQQDGSGNSRSFTAGVMATEDNTAITISDYNTGVVFAGVPTVTLNTITVTLNKGECYVVSGYANIAANLTGFVGALIQSDKPIILHNGNVLGTITNDTGQDMGIDLSVPVEKIGQNYILIEGEGNPGLEKPIVIAHYNNTAIYVNGNSVPVTTINAGQYYIVGNANYQGTSHRNMYIYTSQPAYLYQSLGGDSTSSQQTGGLNFIPPYNCFLTDSIDLMPSVDMIGATTYTGGVMAFTEQGATLRINGVIQTGAVPVIGAPWETYRILGLSGNIKITSTGGVAAGTFGYNGAAGFAGYYAGFSSIPEPTAFSYLDTCYSSPTNFNANYDGVIDSLLWNFGDAASGANDTSSTVNPVHTFSAAGTYTVQLIIYRCQNDTITTTLTINPSATSSQTFVECAGFSVTVGTNTYDSTGIYTDVLTAANGCDSTVTTDLTIKQPTTSSQTFEECAGFSVTVGTNTYDSTGIYTDVLTAANGCDSTVTTDLTIKQPTTSSQTFEECAGFSVTVGTNTYNTTGIYTDVLTNAAGCDSTITTDLTIKQPVTNSQTFVECAGFSVTVGTNTYNITGIYTDALTNAAGCDSTVTTDLTIKQPVTNSKTFVECAGFSVTVGTNTYDSTGIYTDVLTAANGCDSTVTTDLTIIQPTISSQTFVECAGFSITVGTNTYDSTGIYTDVLTAANGCDSTVTTDLTIKQPTISSQTFAECAGFSVTVGTNTYNTTGIYTDVLTNAAGCDSTVTTDLTIKQPTTSSQTFEECAGFSITVGTNTYDSAGIYTDVLTAANGCDSTVTTDLTIKQPTTSSQTFEECAGFSVTVGTNTYDSTGIYTDVLTAANGCDSIIITTLTVYQPPTLVNAYPDTTIHFGEYATLTATANALVTATILWSPSDFLSCTDCPNPVANPDSTTVYYLTVTSSNGCYAIDSVMITVEYPPGGVFVPNAFSPNGDGQNDILFVYGKYVERIEWYIYDRWGEQVFESFSKNDGWNGTYKGKLLNSAVFVYYLKAYQFDKAKIEKYGNVTLVR